MSLTNDAVMMRIMGERAQEHITRKKLFQQIESLIDRPIITYFTSFKYPVMIDDSDVDMLEGILLSMDLSKGLALLINSPGGDGVAAERMINVCRSYSGTKDFWTIIPGKAKSAATMICLGSSKIMMGASSELGPVDPQLHFRDEKDNPIILPAFHVVNTYRTLFARSVAESGNLEPYLQQLSRYDEAQISYFESLIELSKDISIKALKSGMLSNKTEEQIEKDIEVFLMPAATKTHGRPIFLDSAKQVGLTVEGIESTSKIGKIIYELYLRSKFQTDSQVAKLIESKNNSAIVPAPGEL